MESICSQQLSVLRNVSGKFVFNLNNTLVSSGTNWLEVGVFQLLKINNLRQFEKSEQVYLSEKEGEALSTIRNNVIHDAENLGLVPIYEAKSGKESTMDQEL